MWYILISILGLILICIDIVFNFKNKLVYLLLWVLKAPSILFEYFALFWFWGGDGVFTFISIPVNYIVYCILQIFILKKYKENIRVKKVLINSIVFITPVLSVATSYLIAKIFNIEIQIH